MASYPAAGNDPAATVHGISGAKCLRPGGPVLGSRALSQSVAYILSFYTEPEFSVQTRANSKDGFSAFLLVKD
jgi:hypothetical protein